MFTVALLALEANTVIALRTARFWSGHPDSLDEAHLMVTEKVNAAIEAGANLMGGASLEQIVRRYREHVAANTVRLSR